MAILYFSGRAIAQEGETYRAAKWVPQNGYWVVQTNKHNLKSSTIYFYNENNDMVYKEQVEGMIIKLRKRSVKMNLKKVLDRSLMAYNQQHNASENQMLVVNELRRR
jgi:hypothetical protein